jgi:membrane protease YdiL (CAAX protease family)
MSTTVATTRTRRIDLPLVAFFALATGIAWSAFAAVGWLAGAPNLLETQEAFANAESGNPGSEVSAPTWALYLLTRLGDFAFSIAGVVMIAATAGVAGLRQLGRRLVQSIGLRWYAVGLLPVFLYVLAAVAAGAMPSVELSPSTITTALFSLQAGLLVSLLLRGALGEELGLRGFALPRMQQTMAPLRASLIIGVLWGVWHVPVLIGRPVLTVVAFFLVALSASVLSTWMFNGSGGSLVPVLLFHATVNWEEGIETLFPALADADWEAPAVLGLLIAGLAAGAALRRGAHAAH